MPALTIYLIHFEEPYQHARHYLGCTNNLERRLKEHATGTPNGKASKLMLAVHQAGIQWTIARTWKGDYSEERRLHRYNNNPVLCPICNPTALNYAKHRQS